MSFVLDNSVTMRWFFGDGSARSVKYAEQVLDLLGSQDALVPATWGLRKGIPLATLDDELQAAASKAGVRRFGET